MLVLVFWASGSKLIADFPKGIGVLSIKRKKLILNVTVIDAASF